MLNNFNKHFIYALIIGVFILSFFFRLYNLGYSEFQGDEVEAQNHIFDDRTFGDFLRSRQIGPGEYVVTYLSGMAYRNLGFSAFKNFSPEAFMRLPFALAGCLSVVVFYFLILKISGKTSAVIGTSLFGLSGLFVGFSRIVQYQSFTILFGLTALLVLVSSKHRFKELIAGLLLGICVSFHYDGLSFLIPLLLFLVMRRELKKAFFVVAGFLVSVSPYLLLFLTSGFITLKKNIAYIVGDRLFGTHSANYGILYIVGVLKFYYPYAILVLLIFLFVAAVYQAYSINKNQSMIFFLLVVSISLKEITDRRLLLIVFTSVVLFCALYLNKIKFLRSLYANNYKELVLHWFWVSFTVYFLISSKPLTHVYTFLLPGFILISQLLASAKLIGKIVSGFIFISCATYLYWVFINTTPEWPWYGKKTTLSYLPASGFAYGIFGFPYRRELRKADTTLKALEVKTYYSNEKYRMIKYYFRGLKWNDKNPQAYVLVNRPQSFYGISNPEPVYINWKLVEQNQNYKIFLRQ